MNIASTLWNRLAASKKYREEFVVSQVKQGIPFQIHAMRKDAGISQKELAEKSHLTQGVVSRAEDPDYGNLTLNTIVRISAGFDVAFIGNFVPFSKLVQWYEELSESAVRVEPFEKEYKRLRDHKPRLVRRFRRKSAIKEKRPQDAVSKMVGQPPLGNLEKRQLSLDFNGQYCSARNVISFRPAPSGANDNPVRNSLVVAGANSWTKSAEIHN